MDKIVLTQNDKGVGHVGGGAYLKDITLWPTNPKTGALLTPLITTTSMFYPGDRCVPEGMALTVFIAAQRFEDGRYNAALQRRYTITQQEDLQAQISNGFARVILHEIAAEPLVPSDAPSLLGQAFINFEKMTEDEWDEELGSEEGAAALSKSSGGPYWLQDPVYESNRYQFHLQLLEPDLIEVDPNYEGIFEDGIGYLFIDKRARRGQAGDEAGYFFIQYT